MITLPSKEQIKEPLAKLIAETCHCDFEPILAGKPFADVMEHYDSLAMLEILLSIEAEYEINSDDMLPRDYMNEHDLVENFPKNLGELIDKMYEVVDFLNSKKEQDTES